jgi:hypothetical protein
VARILPAAAVNLRIKIFLPHRQIPHRVNLTPASRNTASEARIFKLANRAIPARTAVPAILRHIITLNIAARTNRWPITPNRVQHPISHRIWQRTTRQIRLALMEKILHRHAPPVCWFKHYVTLHNDARNIFFEKILAACGVAQ